MVQLSARWMLVRLAINQLLKELVVVYMCDRSMAQAMGACDLCDGLVVCAMDACERCDQSVAQMIGTCVRTRSLWCPRDWSLACV